jgi:hypothetical protein
MNGISGTRRLRTYVSDHWLNAEQEAILSILRLAPHDPKRAVKRPVILFVPYWTMRTGEPKSRQEIDRLYFPFCSLVVVVVLNPTLQSDSLFKPPTSSPILATELFASVFLSLGGI